MIKIFENQVYYLMDILFPQQTYILHILSSIQKKRSLKCLKMGMPCPANEFILRTHIFKCMAAPQESKEFYL